MFQKIGLKSKIVFLGIMLFTLPFVLPSLVEANSISLGQKHSFFVDSSYDLQEREKIFGTLQRIGQKAYFYIDSEWWEDLSDQAQEIVGKSIQELDVEFSQKIYPILTKNFGSEWNPGIDKDSNITVLIHPMKDQVGGYFNDRDEYSKLENSKSNEREIIYLNADSITNNLTKSFLAHEFTHLITFNQKEKINNIKEEVWLNEARAEYASTLVGYDKEYDKSNLKKRIEIFLKEPSDSITEWQNKEADYGGLNLFTQYLVEQYGIDILTDSLKSKEKGIKSLNYALEQNGFKQDFSEIFTDWTITVLVNDCDFGKEYCYKNKDLKDLQLVPLINILPFKGQSTLGVTYTTKNWSGNWFDFISGKGTLKIEFIGHPENIFKVPYLTHDSSNQYSLGFLELDKDQRGEVSISGFGQDISSVIIIPSMQTKTTNFLNPEPSFSYFWSASVINGIQAQEQDYGQNQENNSNSYLEKPVLEMTKNEILQKIEQIEKILNELKNQLGALTGLEESKENVAGSVNCKIFEQNLSYGLKNNSEVKCLQEFLKSQEKEIYPEALITGNFLSLTKQAVIRFQEKYAEEILHPLDLTQGTGFVGSKTREKLNSLLGVL